MIEALLRKAGQFRRDPVLRRWALRRLTGATPPAPPFVAHRPPYVTTLPAGEPRPSSALNERVASAPSGSITLRLSGAEAEVQSAIPGALFERTFDDLETWLSVQRFAWLPQQTEIDHGWVTALWREWMIRNPEPTDDWAWHPYTAAERAINILDYARRAGGWPGPRDQTMNALAGHAPVIADRLEYFGEHDTSNHLSNNGRGLYLIGLELGLEGYAALGRDILLAEAGRILMASGMLREGSSHYHLLLTRNYASAWLAARRHGRPEAEALERIAQNMLGAARILSLPGGMPLVGDISPDCPPGFLHSLLPGAPSTGWTALLNPDDEAALRALRDGATAPMPRPADGWFRLDHGRWSTLLHCPPTGWSQMPGHGHQDVGSFELHFGGLPVIVDPGRGNYGEAGDAALYRSALVHPGLTLDETDPYPPNKPYYDEAFRRAVGGAPPEVRLRSDGLELVHDGYRRLGAGRATRDLTINGDTITIRDRVAGTGRHAIARRLVTPLAVREQGHGLLLEGGDIAFRVRVDGPASLHPVTLWREYGRGSPATLILVRTRATLPWQGEIRLETIR